MTNPGRSHTVTTCLALVAAVLISGCATTPAPTRTEVSSELRPSGALSAGLSNETRAQQLFVRGLTQAQIGNHGPALDLYSEALRVAPNTAAVLSAAAESHAALGDETSAVYSARQARDADPDNIYYHFQLAQLLVASDQPERAAEIYSDLRTRYPDNPEVLFELARVHTINGDYLEAIDVYQRLLEEIGDDRDVKNEILHLYTRMGDVEGMERVLRDMLEDQPHDADLRKMLSEVYLKQGQSSLATEQLEEAVTQQPGDAEALLNLAELYRERGLADSAEAVLSRAANLEAQDPSQLLAQVAPLYGRASEDGDARRTAIQLLERILSMDPSNADALVMLGDIRLMQDEYQAGGDLLYRSLKENPRDPQVWVQSAGAFLQAGDLERAAEVADEGLMLFPGSLPLLRLAGYAMMDLYRNRDALKRFETAIEIIKEDQSEGQADLSDLHGALGLIYDRLGDTSASDAAYEKALEENPENAAALNNFAYSLAQRGEALDRALKMSKRAVEIEPASAPFLDTLGWIHFKRGESAEAIQWLERAAHADQPSAAVFEHLGDVHEALGNTQAARQAWQRAMEISPDNATLQDKLERQ